MRTRQSQLRTAPWAFAAVLGCARTWAASATGATELKLAAAPPLRSTGSLSPSPDYQPVSSWSLAGRPLPYMSFKASPEEKKLERKSELASIVKFFRDFLAQADPVTIEKAAIPVDKIRAPILLAARTDDHIWLAEAFCVFIKDSLRKARFSYEAKHLSNEKGGHSSSLPFLITASRGLLIDGDPSGASPRGDARGGFPSWAETVAFLRRHPDR